MARKRVYKPWHVRIGKYNCYRRVNGFVEVCRYEVYVASWTPTEARRLFQKLSGDYKD